MRTTRQFLSDLAEYFTEWKRKKIEQGDMNIREVYK